MVHIYIDSVLSPQCCHRSGLCRPEVLLDERNKKSSLVYKLFIVNIQTDNVFELGGKLVVTLYTLLGGIDDLSMSYGIIYDTT